jgi:hypothetical protein
MIRPSHTLVFLAAFNSFVHAQDWVAGRDLKLNELSVQELSNPNFTIPEWSYGHRSTIASTSFTLYAGASDHTNAYGGSPDVQGWTLGGTVPAIGVHVGTAPVVYNFGLGPLLPLLPEEIAMHPQVGDAVVVRWTAPVAGTFTIDSFWQDLDPNGGSGALGAVVINGVVVASGAWANGVGTGFTDNDRVVTLAQGDLVDFVLDTNGDFSFDNTKFNATIVPEPGSAAVLLGATALLALRRRRETV